MDVKTSVLDETAPSDGQMEGAETMGRMGEKRLGVEDSARGEASCGEQPAPEAELHK